MTRFVPDAPLRRNHFGRMPFVIRTDADLDRLRRITGMDFKRVDFSTPIHIENVTPEPMKPVKLHLPFIPYAQKFCKRRENEKTDTSGT